MVPADADSDGADFDGADPHSCDEDADYDHISIGKEETGGNADADPDHRKRGDGSY